MAAPPSVRRIVRPALLAAGLLLAAAPAFPSAFDDGNAAWERGEYVLAVPAYRDAAAEAIPGAMLRLSIAYEFGLGVDADDEAAAEWLRQAAATGDVVAQHELGLWHVTGHVVAGDPEEAVRLFRLAAHRGYLPAQYALAQQLERGDGVRQNLVEADAWYLLLGVRAPAFTWALDGRLRVEPNLTRAEQYEAEERALHLTGRYVTPFD